MSKIQMHRSCVPHDSRRPTLQLAQPEQRTYRLVRKLEIGHLERLPVQRVGRTSLQRREILSVRMLEFLTIGPESTSGAGLHEFSIAENPFRRGVSFGIGTVENGAKDVQANVGAGYASLVKTRAAMGEHQSRARFFGEEFPKNTIACRLFRASEPPTVLEDPRRPPARDLAVDIHANMVVVLNHLAAKAAVDVHACTKPCLDVFRFGQHGPHAFRWVRDVTLEDDFVATWPLSSHPSLRPHRIDPLLRRFASTSPSPHFHTTEDVRLCGPTHEMSEPSSEVVLVKRDHPRATLSNLAVAHDE